MSTDIRQIADTASTVEEVAFGAARTAAHVASDPLGSARKQVKGLERKGTPTARKVNRQVTAQLNAAAAPAKDAVKGINARLNQVAGDLMPERVAVKALHLVKIQARRNDTVGIVAKRALKTINISLKGVARFANRLERATELQSRPAVASKPARSARRTAARRKAA